MFVSRRSRQLLSVLLLLLAALVATSHQFAINGQTDAAQLIMFVCAFALVALALAFRKPVDKLGYLEGSLGLQSQPFDWRQLTYTVLAMPREMYSVIQFRDRTWKQKLGIGACVLFAVTFCVFGVIDLLGYRFLNPLVMTRIDGTRHVVPQWSSGLLFLCIGLTSFIFVPVIALGFNDVSSQIDRRLKLIWSKNSSKSIH